MSFLPGDLHLYTEEDGHTCVTLKGEMIGQFRSQKEAIEKFNELRRVLEDKHPSRELSPDEKRNALVREIGESLTWHNSLRNTGPRKRTRTRRFG